MTNLENIDWAHLPFGYMKTDYNVRCTYKDGKWGEIEVTQDESVTLHMAASCLHYGQEIFEGLKAFRGQDGKIRMFRPDENAKRLQNSAMGHSLVLGHLNLTPLAVLVRATHVIVGLHVTKRQMCPINVL